MIEISTILETAILLLLGFGIVVFCKKRLKVDSPIMLLGSLFAPFLVYIVASGQLVEFRGAGVVAIFQKQANKEIDSIVNFSSVETDAVAKSSKYVKETEEGRTLLAIQSPVEIIYDNKESNSTTYSEVVRLGTRIRSGLLLGGFELLVVLDKSDRVLGYFPRHFFSDILRTDFLFVIRKDDGMISEERLRKIEEQRKSQLKQTLLWDIVEFPRKYADDLGAKKTVRKTDSTKEALSVMLSLDLKAIVVVDAEGKYAGIVRRDALMSKLITPLLGGKIFGSP